MEKKYIKVYINDSFKNVVNNPKQAGEYDTDLGVLYYTKKGWHDRHFRTLFPRYYYQEI